MDKLFLVKASKETISNRNMDFVELTQEELEFLKFCIKERIKDLDRRFVMEADKKELIKNDKKILKKLGKIL